MYTTPLEGGLKLARIWLVTWAVWPYHIDYVCLEVWGALGARDCVKDQLPTTIEPSHWAVKWGLTPVTLWAKLYSLQDEFEIETFFSKSQLQDWDRDFQPLVPRSRLRPRFRFSKSWDRDSFETRIFKVVRPRLVETRQKLLRSRLF